MLALLLAAALPATPVDADGALRLLLGAAPVRTATLPASCHALIAAVPRPTLGDLLAVHLAGLDRGDNRVSGGCAGNRCRVRITHRGEDDDLFAAEYRFTVRQGRLVPASLFCIATP